MGDADDPVANGADRGRASIPRATYRLQLHAGFDFDAAARVLPYLQRLGISHVYCSPISRARAGSLHGYDVVDHAQINPELGGSAGFERFAAAARALELGLLLDLVPNHMGVFGADNEWWMDVLENGPASPFARCFDINWQPPNPALQGKLLVPVLGAAYGAVLEQGEIRLALDRARGRLALAYHEHRFPLDPRSYGGVLRAAAQRPALASTTAQVLTRLADACAAVPPRDAADAGPRLTAQRALQAQLATALASDFALAGALDATIESLNAAPDRAQLHELHECQAFRLAHWRMASDEINYRRFFDIDSLAALRIEDDAVFEQVHGTVLDLAARGLVHGFRIDHPDGLADPAGYFARLQNAYAQRCGIAVPPAGRANGRPFRPLYVVAEKIAAAHEELPRSWALHGTTGYRFATLVNGLFVERRHAERMERVWRDFSQTAEPFEDLQHDCKRLIARGALASQLTMLASRLQRLALADTHTRDYGFNTLRDALAEVAAAMPVYRTYVTAQASAQDRRMIDWAIGRARRRSSALDPALFEFIRHCLLGEPTRGAAASLGHAAASMASRAFAMAFQQFSAPVAAKGVEDTAFYRYHRLVALNEVGADPHLFGISATAFHRASADRAAHWPHTMLATSTHDTKRAEDVRARIDVLSEQPAAWRLALRRWKTSTRAWRREVDGAPAPSNADQALLLQTLLGTLPVEPLTSDALAAYRERIEAYLLKAAREAKLHTSWAMPNADYESALSGFVRGLLGRAEGNPVLADLQARAGAIAWFGALNSLAMTTLKYTSPGVPDLYQGTELTDLSLVDPDNRRPVDYAQRDALLAEFEALHASGRASESLSTFAATPHDGRLKLWIIWRLLNLRRAQPELFDAGGYAPLRVLGPKPRHVIGYARRTASSALLVLAGRKFSELSSAPGLLPVGAAAWAGTRIRRPDWLLAGEGIDVLTGATVALAREALDLAPLFERLPIAVVQVSL